MKMKKIMNAKKSLVLSVALATATLGTFHIKKITAYLTPYFYNLEGQRVTFKDFGFVPHPSQWPASMFKDALLFHVERQFNQSVQPPFMFLENESPFKDYLKNPDEFNEEFLNKVIVPYLLMAHKKHAVARKVMKEGIGNSLELFLTENGIEEQTIQKIMHDIEKVIKIIIDKNKKILFNFLKELDIKPADEHPFRKHSYHTYYQDQKTNFMISNQKNWNKKQHNVLFAINQYKPKSVLDIGTCTGWYPKAISSLSNSKTNIKAIDIDELSLNKLYKEHKQSNERSLTTLPLLASFEELNHAKKLKSDAVLCLALAHHLVLTNGYTINSIFKTLAKLTKKILILEYIDIHDCRVKVACNNPSSFKNESMHKKWVSRVKNYAQSHYNLKTFINVGKKYFKTAQVKDSHRKTRKILIFSK